MRVEDLELLGRNCGIKVLYRVADAEFLRGVAVGTGTVFVIEIIKVAGVADLGIVDVETPHLVHHPRVLPVKQPAT
ncbi:hypothetical protein SDC9_187366 [bioreactor metagenome]|uniref:Uncharacterized protein n=1 Tax=bioreactor metagenome TaxID=1076179 RepID=A0A645HN10_9ZZZZ